MRNAYSGAPTELAEVPEYRDRAPVDRACSLVGGWPYRCPAMGILVDRQGNFVVFGSLILFGGASLLAIAPYLGCLTLPTR